MDKTGIINHMNSLPDLITLPLINDAEFILISDLNEQLFCERKLFFTLTEERIETEEMKKGKEKHFSMTGFTMPERINEMLDSIEQDPFSLHLFLSHMIRDGILIKGRSDGYLFDKGKLLYNIEIKTTTSYNLKMIIPQISFKLSCISEP